MAKKKFNSEATQGRRTSPRLASQRASLQSNGKATVLKNSKPDHDSRSAPIPTVKEELNDGRALETVKEMSNDSKGAASRIKEMSNDSKVVVASIKEMPNDSKDALASIKQISNDDKLVVSRIKEMSNESKGAVSRVKETLRIFNEHYLHFVQEQEKGCKNGEFIDQKAANGSKRKKMSPDEKNEKRTVKRFDLNALTKMREAKQVLYPQKRIGNIPGIDVGFRFYSRAEMVAVGLHSHFMNGIDYMDASYKKLEYKNYEFPLAVAIVMSGQYEDNEDNLDKFWYTGQGGNDWLSSKQQVKDQKMTRGNLALKNNMEKSIPVRVIRGNKSRETEGRTIYIYDGLYKVDRVKSEKGTSGFLIYKFRLMRLQGQPKLTSAQVHFTGAHVLKDGCKVPGLAIKDIAGRQEGIAIPAINLVDNKPIPPTDFTYTKSIQVDESIMLPENAKGCQCKGTCTNPKICACARRNGNDFPYVRQNGGRLIKPKDIVYECGPNCGCGPGCINRASQRGIKHKLEVFKTSEKGWAVRSRGFILPGALVCEYTGILRRTNEIDNESHNDYIFEIDCLHTMKGIGGRERRSIDGSVPISYQDDKIDDNSPEFCIDAGSQGNVARFINHSCEPNLFVQCVLSTHDDPKLARVVLVAAENISPFEELTYDYGYQLDSVVGPDGKVIKLACHCGAADCRKRLY